MVDAVPLLPGTAMRKNPSKAGAFVCPASEGYWETCQRPLN
jgi:hypothetical protein